MVAAHEPVEVREALLNRMVRAREETDQLFALVRKDALYDRPIAERHRILFYIGHLEAFDWNLLCPCLPGLAPFDASLDRLFAFGIDPVDGGLPADQPYDWPSIAAVRAYQQRVRRILDAKLGETAFSDWGGGEAPFTLLNTAIEHRLMHAETLAYMLHQLPLDRKHREPQAVAPASSPVEARQVEIPAGHVILGLPRAATSRFGWDNEYEAHAVSVPSFRIDCYKVTNGQFLEFLEAGGYDNRSLWNPESWDWKERQDIQHPRFWRPNGEAWLYRTMFDEIPLPMNWPAYTSHAEASAYARWAGGRLPTEGEWQRAAYGSRDEGDRGYPWGESAPQPCHGFFNFLRWDPIPVNSVPASRSDFGVEGLLANGWEWTSSVFEPFTGFRPFSFYPGYSADFFDGRHFVMKGGSPRTAACMLRREFRNWFQPYYPYVYAGFRCVC